MLVFPLHIERQRVPQGRSAYAAAWEYRRRPRYDISAMPRGHGAADKRERERAMTEFSALSLRTSPGELAKRLYGDHMGQICLTMTYPLPT
jgi:hypothetical protein